MTVLFAARQLVQPFEVVGVQFVTKDAQVEIALGLMGHLALGVENGGQLVERLFVDRSCPFAPQVFQHFLDRVVPEESARPKEGLDQ